MTCTQKTKDMRHIFTHTQSRPLRSTMNSFCSNLQFYHQMVFKESSRSVITWCLFISIPILFVEKIQMWDGIQRKGTGTKNNPTTLECCWAKPVDTQQWRWWLNLSQKNKKRCRVEVENPQTWSFHGQRINVTITTNQRNWVTTVECLQKEEHYRIIFPHINNWQWDLWNEFVIFSNKHAVHVNEAR